VIIATLCSGCAARAPRQVFVNRGVAAAADGDFDAAKRDFTRSQRRNEFQPAVELSLYVDLIDDVAEGAYSPENAVRFFSGVEALDNGDYCQGATLLHAADSEQSILLTRVLVGWAFFKWALHGTGLSSVLDVSRLAGCDVEPSEVPDERTLLQAAMDTLEDAAVKYPDSAFPHFYLAPTYMFAGKFDEAEDACRAAAMRGSACPDYVLKGIEQLRARSN
jgi:tetratricopeptide (TPR) repeat protein